jgi:hypothetical protein
MAGWEDFDGADVSEDVREVKQKREDLMRLCLRVLGTEDGQKLMEWLREMYVDVPVAVPGADPSYAFYADGQRSVVRDLIARINQARNL